ncbi:MAG: GNAT family N-acetyltransferase [Clostridium sp.]|uniref:GNAT family N-acetyltransferase n=1 Tax=Clostridium sp. TaxID=1506 RepID=UPI0032164B22
MIIYKKNTLDFNTYKILRQSVNWSCPPETQAIRAINNTLVSVVAYNDDIPVGMGRLLGDGALYYQIYDVVVRKEYQGQKIGTNIINELINYIEKNRTQGERVSIALAAEPGKEEFYEKLGFRRLPHQYCGAGLRKVIKD